MSRSATDLQSLTPVPSAHSLNTLPGGESAPSPRNQGSTIAASLEVGTSPSSICFAWYQPIPRLGTPQPTNTTSHVSASPPRSRDMSESSDADSRISATSEDSRRSAVMRVGEAMRLRASADRRGALSPLAPTRPSARSTSVCARMSGVSGVSQEVERRSHHRRTIDHHQSASKHGRVTPNCLTENMYPDSPEPRSPDAVMARFPWGDAPWSDTLVCPYFFFFLFSAQCARRTIAPRAVPVRAVVRRRGGRVRADAHAPERPGDRRGCGDEQEGPHHPCRWRDGDRQGAWCRPCLPRVGVDLPQRPRRAGAWDEICAGGILLGSRIGNRHHNRRRSSSA